MEQSRNLFLTPVMTAPLDQLRDTRRKDSSNALKPMTATGELDSLNSTNTGQQLLTVCPAPRTGSPVSHKGSQLHRGGSHTLSLSLSTYDPHPTLPSLPSSLLMSEMSPRPLFRSLVIILTIAAGG